MFVADVQKRVYILFVYAVCFNTQISTFLRAEAIKFDVGRS